MSCSLVVLVAGCGGSSTRSAGVPTGRPTASAPAPAVFRGDGYQFTPPASWFAKPAVGPWRIGVSPLAFVTGFATFTSPHGDPWMVIGQRPVAAGVSLDDWIARMVESRTITYDRSMCLPAEHLGRAHLAGEPAQIRSFHCPADGPSGVAVQVLAIHRGHGFVAMCASPQGRAGSLGAFETACTGWLGTFDFAT